MHPLAGIAIVAGLLAALVGFLALWQQRRHPHPEVVRKCLHVGMGLVTLSFPALFDEPWPVYLLAGLSTALLVTIKRHQGLRAVGSVVDGVQRKSWGDLCFPWSVALVFDLANGDVILFAIPILLLALADAVAALIGVFYGHAHYSAAGSWKSMEGSIAFFTVAFLSTHVPLLLGTNVGRVESLLLGLTIGLLIMLIEGFAWEGWDNLLIPVGAFFFLQAYLPLDQGTLLSHLIGIMIWVLATFALKRFSTLDDAALLSAAFVLFVTSSLGDWRWLPPPLLMYFGYSILWRRPEQLIERRHAAYMVIAISAGGLALLLAEKYALVPDLLPAYVAYYAAQLAFVGVVWYRETRPEVGEGQLIVESSWRSWVLVCLPYPLLAGCSSFTINATAGMLLPVAISTYLFARQLPKPAGSRREWFPWEVRTLLGLIAGMLAWLPTFIWAGGA